MPLAAPLLSWLSAHALLNPELDAPPELSAWALMLAANAALATSALAAGMLGVLAPYGGFNSDPKDSSLVRFFGPKMNSQLGWYVMELPALLAGVYALSLTGVRGFVRRPPHVQLAVACYLTHYFNRGVVFPAKRGRSDKYEPCGTFVLGAVFNSLNGYALIRYLTHFGAGTVLDDATARTWVGAGVFFLGVYVNMMADMLLMKLAEKKHQVTVSKRNKNIKRYAVPGGFFAFNFVTSANYLGELVEWVGFLLMTWPSPASACFVWMTFCNLAPRAYAKHQRYLKEIPAYGTLGRKALIPFLF